MKRKSILVAICSVFAFFTTAYAGSILGDVNADNKVGLEEVIYALQIVAGIRPSATGTLDHLELDQVNVDTFKHLRWVGDTAQIEVIGTYTNSYKQFLTSDLTWTSSNPDAATVSKTGLVTALAGGDTAITATDPTTSKTVQIYCVTIDPGHY
jgi:hypothetical protein